MEYRKEPIKSHPDYMIDTDGNIYNKNGKLKKLHKHKHGYLHTSFSENGKISTHKVHRLVAEQFIPNDDPDNKIHVNHKNGDKTKNDLDNLEWVTPQENVLHAINVLGNFNTKELYGINSKTGDIEYYFKSLADGGRYFAKDINNYRYAENNIWRVMNGIRNTYKGCKWVYEEDMYSYYFYNNMNFPVLFYMDDVQTYVPETLYKQYTNPIMYCTQPIYYNPIMYS